jgi:hypothetical protein
MLGLFAEQLRMHDVPKDLGGRIVEATRLAIALHLQRSPQVQIGGADRRGGAAMDGGVSPAPPLAMPIAGTLAEGDAE